MTNEAQLLFACCRAHPTAGDGARLGSILRATIDWDAAIRMAEAHRVLALVAWNLRSVAPNLVPQDVSRRLDTHLGGVAARNLWLAIELLTIFRLLEAHGIRAVPFKGPVLAASVYGSLALRECDDLDLLVRRQDLGRIGRLLVAHGYRRPYRYMPLYEWLLPAGRSERQFVGLARDPVLIEMHGRAIHWHYCVSLETDALLDRAGPVALAGTRVPGLAPDDLLIVLCSHAARHGWPFAAQICDVAELVRAHALDWDRDLAEARRLGLARVLAVTLRLAHDLVGLELPRPLAEAVEADDGASRLAADITDRLLARRNPTGDSPNPWLYLRSRERRRDRVCFVLRAALRESGRYLFRPVWRWQFLRDPALPVDFL